MRRFTVIVALLTLGALLLASQQVIVVKKKGGCTASYANEYLTGAVWTAGPDASEGDASTGWTNGGLTTFDSGGGTAYSGSYSLRAIADSDTDRVYQAVTLSANTLYRLSWYLRHTGSGGGWRCGIGPDTSSARIAIWGLTSADADFEQKSALFRWHSLADNVLCRENSGTNDGGVYIDYVSIAEATPCLGSDLHTTANAASLTNEANATTGWNNINTLNSFTSDGTGAADGSYHLLADATTNPAANNGFNIDLASAPFSLSNGSNYLLLFKVKHIGSGGTWTCGHSSGANGMRDLSYNNVSIPVTMTTYVAMGWQITYSAAQRYFVCGEDTVANDGGMYLDSFVVQAILVE